LTGKYLIGLMHARELTSFKCISLSFEQKILTVVDDNYVVLSDDITLALIRRDICDDPTKEVVLHYRILPLC